MSSETINNDVARKAYGMETAPKTKSTRNLLIAGCAGLIVTYWSVHGLYMAEKVNLGDLVRQHPDVAQCVLDRQYQTDLEKYFERAKRGGTVPSGEQIISQRLTSNMMQTAIEQGCTRPDGTVVTAQPLAKGPTQLTP